LKKELICAAFCDGLDIRSVPAGYAVTTPYTNSDGDPILIYCVHDERGRWRLEDDGTQVPLLEASGVDMSGASRKGAFQQLLDEYGVQFNVTAQTLYSDPLQDSELGEAAIRFIGLLLRLQDLSLLSPQIVRSTFREDALAAIHKAFDGRAAVQDQSSIGGDLPEADVVITGPSSVPVGGYLATSEERALHALVVKMEADKYRDISASIILLLERSKDNPVKPSTLALAMARLDAVVSFRDAQRDTLDRIARTARIQSSFIQ
jgi:hypothetical protein